MRKPKSYQKFMHNEQGSILMSTLLIIFSLFALAIILIRLEILSFDKIVEKQKSYLCTKKFNYKEYSYIKTMERLNKVIVSGKGLEVIGYIIPIFKAFGESVKKTAKAIQLLSSYKYRYSLFILNKEGCIFSPLQYLTPYKFKLKLMRDKLERSILRKKKWNRYVGYGKTFVRTKTSLLKRKIEQQSWDIHVREATSLLSL